MIELFSFIERIKDPKTIDLFCRIFIQHGALRSNELESAVNYSELDRLKVVPLIFGLIPLRALKRKSFDELIKPYIKAHLTNLGVTPTEELVSVLKSIADQYFNTFPAASDNFGSTKRKRKMGIADLKINSSLYKTIQNKQNNRCAICGILFNGEVEETLDHIIPFRLVGDVKSGVNWQILCMSCNRGKTAWFSSLQSMEALNWIYSNTLTDFDTFPTSQTKYIALVQRRKCEYIGCNNTANNEELILKKRIESGLAIVDNLVVFCKPHS